MKSFMLKRVVVSALCVCAALSWAQGTETEAVQPNVIVILADDLGYGSLGCYGAPEEFLRTPNIDRLAAEGRQFTNAHTPCSVCSPTRYAVLTGRYCWRTGASSGVYGTYDPLHIETTRLTLGSLFKKNGYATAAIGKWHLGFGSSAKVDFRESLKPGPLDLGFDYDFLVPTNHGDPTGIFIENDKVAGLRSKKMIPGGTIYRGKPVNGLDAPQRVDDEEQGVLTDHVVSWIQQQAEQKKPFFIYFTPVTVHEPITPSAKNKGKSGCGPYGDFIMDLDDSVGRIMAELEKSGLAENTIIVLTSDNGGEIGKTFTGSQQVAIKAGFKINGVLRAGKHGVYDGGMRVPYIVRWPAKVPANSKNDQMISLVDTLATFAAASGFDLSHEKGTAEDSVNVLAAWTGDNKTPVRRGLITNSEDGVFTVRLGEWKWIEGLPAPAILAKGKSSRRDEFHPQLYHIDDDISEARDVSASHPEVDSMMKALLKKVRETESAKLLAMPTN